MGRIIVEEWVRCRHVVARARGQCGHAAGGHLPAFVSRFRVSGRGEMIRKKEWKGAYLHVFGCVIRTTFAFVGEWGCGRIVRCRSPGAVWPHRRRCAGLYGPVAVVSKCGACGCIIIRAAWCGPCRC